MRRDLFVPCFVLELRFPWVGEHHDCSYAAVSLIFTGHNHVSCDSKGYLDNSNKIKYLSNRLRAMPLANFTRNQKANKLNTALFKRTEIENIRQ